MTTKRAMLPLLLVFAIVLPATQPSEFGGSRKAECKGVIEVVHVEWKGGPPSLSIKLDDGQQWTVYLGSLRYLIDNNFSPKAGQRIEVEGFLFAEGQLMAIRVSLPEIKKTLRLRDADGRPLWRGPHRKVPGQ